MFFYVTRTIASNVCFPTPFSLKLIQYCVTQPIKTHILSKQQYFNLDLTLQVILCTAFTTLGSYPTK